MIPYPREDFKKYICALGRHRIERLYDLFGGLDPDLETTNDGMCSLGQLELWLYLAAFVDDDDAGNEIGWNVRDLISEDAVNTYSDGRPVATTGRWDDSWVRCPLGLEIPPPVIDGLLDATEGIGTLREIDCDDKEQDR